MHLEATQDCYIEDHTASDETYKLKIQFVLGRLSCDVHRCLLMGLAHFDLRVLRPGVIHLRTLLTHIAHVFTQATIVAIVLEDEMLDEVETGIVNRRIRFMILA